MGAANDHARVERDDIRVHDFPLPMATAHGVACLIAVKSGAYY